MITQYVNTNKVLVKHSDNHNPRWWKLSNAEIKGFHYVRNHPDDDNNKSLQILIEIKGFWLLEVEKGME